MRRSKISISIAAIAAITVASAAPSALAAKKTLRWLALKTPEQVAEFKKVFNEYGKSRNVALDVTISDWGTFISKNLMSIASGRYNDFYSWGTDAFAPMANSNTLVPLDNYIKQSKFNISRIDKMAIKNWTKKGKLWGMPFGHFPTVLYYNKTLFDQAGVPYPTHNWEDNNWNWEAFIATARKLTKMSENGRTFKQAGIGGMQLYMTFPWYFGGDWTDENCTKSLLNDPKVAKGLQEVADLSLKYKVQNPSADFAQGRTAMMVDGSWGLFSFAKNKNLKFDVAASPVGTSGNHSVTGYVDAFSIGYSKNKDEVWNFIKWIFADRDRLYKWLEADNGGCAVPADKQMRSKFVENGKAKLPGIDFQVIADAVDYGTPMYLRNSSNWPKIQMTLDTAVNSIMSGKKTAHIALSEINSVVDKLIKSGR